MMQLPPIVLRDALTRFPLIRGTLLLLPFILILVWTFHFRGGVSWNKSADDVFNYHPLFMTLALLAWNEAAAAFRSPLYPYASRLITRDAHAITHLLGVGFAAVGLAAVFKFHNEHHFNNLRSLHSWMGLTTIILVGIQWLIGSLAFYLPRDSGLKFTTWVMRNLTWVKHAHRYVGCAIVMMVGFTAIAGTLENLTFLKACEGGDSVGGECVTGNLFGFSLAAVVISTLALFVSHAPVTSPYVRTTGGGAGARVGGNAAGVSVSLPSSSFSSEGERIDIGLLEGEDVGVRGDDDDDLAYDDDNEEEEGGGRATAR